MKYLNVFAMVFAVWAFTACKTIYSDRELSREEEEVSSSLSFQDQILGEWKLISFDKPLNPNMSVPEKEAYEKFLEELRSVYRLTLFGDGSYQRTTLKATERGRWRMTDGDSRIVLFSEGGVESYFEVREYVEPLLLLVENHEGEEYLYHLHRN
ncbi:MAG: hypothetical protein CSA95_07040 [Bacteroidetes bacterium]|nr:MAG: hypothetical protein CSA95_07040 [Bacteroidota bacterium]